MSRAQGLWLGSWNTSLGGCRRSIVSAAKTASKPDAGVAVGLGQVGGELDRSLCKSRIQLGEQLYHAKRQRARHATLALRSETAHAKHVHDGGSLGG